MRVLFIASPLVGHVLPSVALARAFVQHGGASTLMTVVEGLTARAR